MFYTFMQNNSGGSWAGPAIAVCVEAVSQEAAIERAESVAGLYFDGEGDCRCCGNRWNTYAEEASTPSVYGGPIQEYDGGICGNGQIPWKIFFLDGRVEEGARVP